MEQKICQCCAMPIDESTFGTEADGSKTKITACIATRTGTSPKTVQWTK